MWKTAKKYFLDLFFPKICVNCSKQGSYLCDDCFSLIEICDLQYCPYCQPPQPRFDNRICKKHCSNIDSLFAACDYKNKIIQKTLHLYKYEPCCKEMASSLAKIIYGHIRACGKSSADFSGCLITGVPLADKKMRWRGFNQSYEVAKILANLLNIEFLPLLEKTKDNKSQAELGRLERMKNVENCYSLSKTAPDISGKTVLILDDVFTTGATMEECAKTLKQARAKNVIAITLAKET